MEPKKITPRREGYYTTSEARHYGWYMQLLYELRGKGEIQSFKFPRDNRNYWKIEELEAWSNSAPRTRGVAAS